MNLWLKTSYKNNALKVVLPSNLVTRISNVYLEQIDYLFHTHPDMKELHIDIAETELIDSTGVGFLLAFYKAAHKNNVETYILNANFNIVRILKLSKLDKYFHIS